MNLTIGEPGLPAMEDLEQEDKWVLSKLNTLIRERCTANLERVRDRRCIQQGL